MKPIRVVDHDPSWPATFEAERVRLAAELGAMVREWHHVGSTAVPGLAAKPKIDIDAVLRSERLLGQAIARLTGAPSYAFHGEPWGDGMWTFTADRGRHGVRLYLCLPGNPAHGRRLLFRDWLRGHPRDAAEYEALKRRLAGEAPLDWAAYGDGKSEFVARIVALAEREAVTLLPQASTSGR